jgi:hypothetical protein
MPTEWCSIVKVT